MEHHTDPTELAAILTYLAGATNTIKRGHNLRGVQREYMLLVPLPRH